MYRVILLGVAAALTASAQDRLLDSARQALEERLANTPNYTCLLEIDRLVYPNAARSRYSSKEIARLEISVIGGRENFAWPGDATTQEQIEPLLGPGLSSTGEFSAHGRSTFLDPRSSIERLPDDRQTQDGLVGYSYRVPLEASRYMVAGDDTGSAAPYEGELWVEAGSGQLVRFGVRVPQAPPKIGVRHIDSYVLYGSRDVSGRSVWLPSESRIVVESSAGRAFQNDLRYLDCRAFQAEATLLFDEDAEQSDKPADLVQAVAVPEGLELDLELATSFDSKSVRAGDAFQARLLESAGELPRDATVNGRVRRVGLIDVGSGRGAKRVVSMTLELLDVRWRGRCGRLSGTLEAVRRIPDMAPVNPDGLQLPRAFYNSDRALGYRTSPRLSAKGTGSFVILGDLYAIPKGARMRWRTETPPEGACALR